MARVAKVYSHALSFAQCRQWLAANLPRAECVEVSSTAEAARLAAAESGAAAIAGKPAAAAYGLEIAARDIEDNPDNTTRFLVIGKQQAPPSGVDKTSVLFATPSKPGSLVRLLRCFADNEVNMIRIESRPSRQAMWEYVFFVDVEGHSQDPAVAAALEELRRRSSMVKTLGSYPAAAL